MDPIPQTRQYLTNLLDFVEDPDTLETHGYITQHLNEEQLSLKQRCSGCSKTLAQINKEAAKLEAQRKAWERKQLELAEEDVTCTAGTGSKDEMPSTTASSEPDTDQKAPKNMFLCQFHPGRVVDKHWTCCSQHVSQKNPCTGADGHDLILQSLGDLTSLYQMHSTPPFRSFRGSTIRAAVALDCEMGTAISGDVELIRISMIDYFSGEVLVDSLVQPTVRMAHLNTRYSGVTFPALNAARRAGNVLWGTEGARRAVFDFVGPETVVIGHGVGNDLRALKWLHSRVVDSYVIEFNVMKKEEEEKKTQEEQEKRVREIMERMQLEDNKASEATGLPAIVDETVEQKEEEEAVPVGEVKAKIRKPKGSGRLSLKTMARELLGKEIQTGQGHDSLEDADAARQLVHWLISHPERSWLAYMPADGPVGERVCRRLPTSPEAYAEGRGAELRLDNTRKHI